MTVIQAQFQCQPAGFVSPGQHSCFSKVAFTIPTNRMTPGIPVNLCWKVSSKQKSATSLQGIKSSVFCSAQEVECVDEKFAASPQIVWLIKPKRKMSFVCPKAVHKNFHRLTFRRRLSWPCCAASPWLPDQGALVRSRPQTQGASNEAGQGPQEPGRPGGADQHPGATAPGQTGARVCKCRRRGPWKVWVLILVLVNTNAHLSFYESRVPAGDDWTTLFIAWRIPPGSWHSHCISPTATRRASLSGGRYRHAVVLNWTFFS